jgi:hypothetical protein
MNPLSFHAKLANLNLNAYNSRLIYQRQEAREHTLGHTPYQPVLRWIRGPGARAAFDYKLVHLGCAFRFQVIDRDPESRGDFPVKSERLRLLSRPGYVERGGRGEYEWRYIYLRDEWISGLNSVEPPQRLPARREINAHLLAGFPYGREAKVRVARLPTTAGQRKVARPVIAGHYRPLYY